MNIQLHNSNWIINTAGITEDNIDDVAWCVETPQLEKQARAAASSIFRKLNPLKERNLSKDEYMKAVENLADNKAEKKLLEKAGILCSCQMEDCTVSTKFMAI